MTSSKLRLTEDFREAKGEVDRQLREGEWSVAKLRTQNEIKTLAMNRSD